MKKGCHSEKKLIIIILLLCFCVGKSKLGLWQSFKRSDQRWRDGWKKYYKFFFFYLGKIKPKTMYVIKEMAQLYFSLYLILLL